MVQTNIKFPDRRKSGFTLLELLVVVGILAALVALALPYYQDYVNQSKLTAAEADLQTFKKALAMYDQLEPVPFIGTSTLVLIGKYMQDYRTFTGQINPVDPWGNDYYLIASEGVFISNGPNGTRDTTAAPWRVPIGDDILVTWKPPFFVTGARAVNQNTIEVTFSRKIQDASAVLSNVFCTSVTGMTVSATKVQKVADTVYRIILSTNMVKGNTYTVTIAARTAVDGKAAYDANPETTAAGGLATFKY